MDGFSHQSKLSTQSQGKGCCIVLGAVEAGMQCFDLAAEWGEQAVKGFFNGGCDCLLDACGKGRHIHLIVKFSQNLAETIENIISAYCGGGCNSGVDQTSLCGTERVASRAAIKGRGMIVSARGRHIVVERHINLLSASKSYIVSEAGGMSHIVIID